MIVDGGTGNGGYEEFLKMRHKDEGSLESNSSGDSGHETCDDLFQQEQFCTFNTTYGPIVYTHFTVSITNGS
jgi:hypothetical protein